jgi:hypothetical protein
LSEESVRLAAERKRAWVETRDRALAAVGVTRAEIAVLVTLNYGIVPPPERLPAIAEAENRQDEPSVTEHECRGALDACLAKGWVQVLDEPALARIAADLRAGGFLGPIYGGLPEAGCVDFTEAGAALWQRYLEAVGRQDRSFAYTDIVREKTAWYFRTREAAEKALAAFRAEDDFFAASEPVAIGPWRARWWRRFPEGFRVEVETRRQWQGRCGCGGDTTHFDREGLDEPRLRAILDRNRITLAQWDLLKRQEHGPLHGRRHEPRPALDECLRYGWLQVVDAPVVEEVESLLRDDAAQPVVAAELTPGTIEFTPAGAALYDAILGEWLGPEWADRVHASTVHEWEEHLYCETVAGFDGAHRWNGDNRDVVRESRVVPIGPWCVKWWERFPSGFRREVEYGWDE